MNWLKGVNINKQLIKSKPCEDMQGKQEGKKVIKSKKDIYKELYHTIVYL